MKRTTQYIRNSLIRCYSHQEIEAFIYIIFNHIYNYSKNDLILNAGNTLPESDFYKIKEIVSRLMLQEPIQYILGETEFFGLPFKVSHGVLIPRNETEELVDLILKNHSKGKLKVLDVGTGSGCISISLKNNRYDFDVYACDISGEALRMAKENAELNNVDVEFFQFDILSDEELPFSDFNIIVSNPPYVTKKEKKLMEANVLEHEPWLALFVPDDDPLQFYRVIVQKSRKYLAQKGMLYFEINEAYGEEVIQLLKDANFEATIFKDINGKDRMVKARRN